MKILIVDDAEKLALALVKGLALKGFATDVLHDGVDALNRISLHGGEYDLVVLIFSYVRELEGRKHPLVRKMTVLYEESLMSVPLAA